MSRRIDYDGAQLLLFVAGVIGYLVVFIYYLTFGDIAFSERMFFFIASICYGWLAWESVQARQEMLISAVMACPMIAAGVVLADIKTHGVIIPRLPLTGIYVAAALICGFTALWTRSAAKKNSGRNGRAGGLNADGSAPEPGPGASGGYDPYGPGAGYDPYGPGAGYDPYGRNAGGRSSGANPGATGARAETNGRGPGFGNADGYSGYGTWEHYEPGSQYRKEGDERYSQSEFRSGSGAPEDIDFSDAGVFAALTYDDSLLRAVMVPLGFMLKNSSSGAELQQIFMDETMERLRIPEESMDRAKGYAEEGRHCSMWNVNLCMQEAKLDARDPRLAAAFFFSISGSLFYDEQVTTEEVRLFNQMAQAFQVAPAMADRIFRQLVKDYNLFYDGESGRYTAYGYSRAGAGTGAGAGYGYGGSAGASAGNAEGDGYRQQEEQDRKQQKKEPSYTSKELRNAYITLQIRKDASDAEVKAAYRKLIARYHPDKAIARGLSESEVASCNEITQKLNQAYDILRQERNL